MRLAYSGYDAAGRAVEDFIDAHGPQEAADTLRERGVFVTRVDEAASSSSAKKAGGGFKLPLGRGKRIKQVTQFTRQLHVLTSTGTAITQALAALERQSAREPRWGAVVTDLRKRVEAGEPLSRALKEHPDRFNEVYRSLIEAGETTGKLTPMLERLAALSAKQSHVRSAVMAAMTYPALLCTLSLGVLMVMLLFVVPQFATMFEELGVPLPITTLALVMLGSGLRDWWFVFFPALFATIGGFIWWLGHGGREWIAGAVLELPMVGGMFRSFVTARFCRLLGILVDSYLPLMDVLDLLERAMGNEKYAALMRTIGQTVERGEPMSVALEGSDLIEPSVTEAVRSGESSGKLSVSLLAVADFMDEENAVVIKSLSSIIEPVILIGLGGVVGGVALSIFLPLFDLTAMSGG